LDVECGAALVADPSAPYIHVGSSAVTVSLLNETTGVPESVTNSTLSGMNVSSLVVTH